MAGEGPETSAAKAQPQRCFKARILPIRAKSYELSFASSEKPLEISICPKPPNSKPDVAVIEALVAALTPNFAAGTCPLCHYRTQSLQTFRLRRRV